MRFLVAGVALGLSLLVASCAGTRCTFNSQCGAHRYCSAGACYQDCVIDTDCPRGSGCTPVGMCEVGYDGGTPDLGAGDMAREDMGTPTPDFGPPPGDLGSPPGDLGSPPADLGSPPGDLGPPPADLGPPPADSGTPKGYLADCASDGECASGHCIPELPGAPHVCSKTCTSDTDCADWHYCLRPGTATTGPGVCAYDDTGASCTATTGTCSFACLYDAPSPGHCSHLCGTAADCPGGYGCVYSSPGDSTSLKVCAWVHEECPGSVSQCDTSVGFCGAGGAGCTGNCASSSDCPTVEGSAETCGSAGGATYTVCNPPGGSGSQGSICATNADCRSGLCVNDGSAGTLMKCVERCNPRTGCPAGYGCNAVFITGLGVARNVCLPAGTGRAGDPCVDGTSCRSSACGSSSHRCLDSCLDGFCPPGTTCGSDGLTVDGIALSSCR